MDFKSIDKGPRNNSNTSDEDDDHRSSNHSSTDNGSARDDESNKAGISLVTAADTDDDPNATDAPSTVTLKRKRATIDESTLTESDLLKLENRRAYNRHCAAKARKRGKALVAQLQSQVEELTKDKAELKRSNDLMRTQLDLLEQQNRTLLLNQLSAQTSQRNTNNFLSGDNLGALGGFVGSGFLANRAGHLNPSAAASILGSTGVGTTNDTLGSISFLDRLRLERHLQIQQQQQLLGLMAPSTELSSHVDVNQDLVLEGLRKNKNNNFFG